MVVYKKCAHQSLWKTPLCRKYLSGDVIQLTKKVTDIFVGTVVAFLNYSSLDIVDKQCCLETRCT